MKISEQCFTIPLSGKQEKANEFEVVKIRRVHAHTDVVASWVIRARWWEIQRFVLKLKAN